MPETPDIIDAVEAVESLASPAPAGHIIFVCRWVDSRLFLAGFRFPYAVYGQQC